MQQLKTHYIIHFKLEYLKMFIKQCKGTSEAVEYLYLSGINIPVRILLSHMLRMLKYVQRN